jgi:hypothetical protein
MTPQEQQQQVRQRLGRQMTLHVQRVMEGWMTMQQQLQQR